MKTKERILLTSLSLFNREGEPNVTAVDIANELDISPGNLYYHFKGKDPIIKRLFRDFESGFTELVSLQSDQDLDIDNSWSLLLNLFEQIYGFRFFYRNTQDILQRLPDIRQRFKKLLELHLATTKLILLSLIEKGAMTADQQAVNVLAKQMVMTVTYWLQFNELTDTEPDPMLLYHQGVYQVLSLIVPHLHEDHRHTYAQALQILNDATEYRLSDI